MSDIIDIIHSIEPISLNEMSGVKLMNRIDSKYPTNMETLLSIAPLWKDHFFIQENEGKLISNYRSLYFDTDDALTYTIHHNYKLNRQKIRQRIYVDSKIAFCEVKNKKNNGRTKKKRTQIPLDCWGNLYATPEITQFLNDKIWITKKELFPRLETAFERITLVNKVKTERITIDFNIKFYNHISNIHISASNLVIIEVKQDATKPSIFKDILLNAKVKKKGLSKYCLGMLLTDYNIKYNRFKEKIRYINKITNNKFIIKSLE